MGNFYVNICVTELTSAQLEAWFAAAHFPSYIGPAVNGWVCMVSEPLDMQDSETIDSFGTFLTKDSSRTAVAVLNHDDDILKIDIFQNGARKASYNSCPSYFLESPTESDLRPYLDNLSAFAALKSGAAEEQIREVLFDEKLGVFACDLHQAVAGMLGLPEYSVAAGFKYISRGESEVGWTFVPGKAPDDT